VPIVLKSGSLKLLEPSGSVRACSGIALPSTFILSCRACEFEMFLRNVATVSWHVFSDSAALSQKIAFTLGVTPCSVEIYLLSCRGSRGLLNNTVIQFKLFYVLFLALSSFLLLFRCILSFCIYFLRFQFVFLWAGIA